MVVPWWFGFACTLEVKEQSAVGMILVFGGLIVVDDANAVCLRKRKRKRKMSSNKPSVRREPKYRVIDKNPGLVKIVSNFNTLDYLRFTTITGVSITVGYLAGLKSNTRVSSMVTGGLIGIWTGFMFAYQNSTGRLTGFFPNHDDHTSSSS